MAGLEHTGLTGVLTVTAGPYILNGPVVDLPDVRPVWMSAAIRGEDRTLSLTEGRSPREHRRDATEHLLPMYISGEVDPDGEPVECDTESAFMANLRVNIDWLLVNVIDPTTAADVELLVPGDAMPRAGQIRFMNLVPGELRDDGLAMKAILEVKIPYPSQFIAS